jgi:hypothetical protein
MYDDLGNDRYRAKPGAQGPDHGDASEILWKMLQDDRVFTAKGHLVAMLKLHVAARLAVVNETSRVRWGFSDPHNEIWNPGYWQSPQVLNSGANAFDAVNDPFPQAGVFPYPYETGCRSASLLVELKGAADALFGAFGTVGVQSFNNGAKGPPDAGIEQNTLTSGLLQFRDNLGTGLPNLKNWVPGDRGYIRGNDSNSMLAGEWIIYLGYGDNFWGFLGADSAVDTLYGWAHASFMPDGGGTVQGYRYWSGVGLEKNR